MNRIVGVGAHGDPGVPVATPVALVLRADTDNVLLGTHSHTAGEMMHRDSSATIQLVLVVLLVLLFHHHHHHHC